MSARSLTDLHLSLRDQGTLLVFHGLLTDPLLTALGAVVRQRLQAAGVEGRRARDLFAAFIEQGQNILRYSADRDPAGDVEQAVGIISVGRAADRYFVASANQVVPAQVEHLRAQFAVLNDLDADALKALHRQRLREPPPPTSKGAGVGLIQMARSGVGGIDVAFSTDGAGTPYFAIKVTL